MAILLGRTRRTANRRAKGVGQKNSPNGPNPIEAQDSGLVKNDSEQRFQVHLPDGTTPCLNTIESAIALMAYEAGLALDRGIRARSLSSKAKSVTTSRPIVHYLAAMAAPGVKLLIAKEAGVDLDSLKAPKEAPQTPPQPATLTLRQADLAFEAGPTIFAEVSRMLEALGCETEEQWRGAYRAVYGIVHRNFQYWVRCRWAEGERRNHFYLWLPTRDGIRDKLAPLVESLIAPETTLEGALRALRAAEGTLLTGAPALRGRQVKRLVVNRRHKKT